MNLTLGKKIGGGFSIVLLLALAVGFLAIRAMNSGVTASNNIAEDRVPRLIVYNDLQKNLLMAAYNARAFSDTGDENTLTATYGYLKKLRANVAQVREFNEKVYYENTAKFLDKFSADLDRYESIIDDQVLSTREINETTMKIVEVGRVALGKLEEMIRAMSSTQRDFLNAGNLSTAATYTMNMADTSSVYARLAAVLEQLLLAERNSDASLLKSVRESLPAILEDAKTVRTRLVRQECLDLFDSGAEAYQQLVELAGKLADSQEKSMSQASARVALYLDLVKQSEGIIELTTSNTTQTVNDAAATLSSSTHMITILLCSVLVVGLALALLITRMVVNPLIRTQAFARAVAGGDLERELDVHSKDETGMLADDLRAMVVSLKQSISEAHRKSEEAEKASAEAKEAMGRAEEAARRAESAKKEGMLAAANQLESVVDAISSASTELSAQIEQSDKSARHSAERLAEAATAMNEMNSTVQEVAKNASSTAQMSSETKQQASHGAEIVRQSLESTERVHKASLELKTDMEALNRHAESISNIMSMISDIADQTNLLALNAAIEAARAGEAGRGFAVVADEVRKLAEKTMASTNEVGAAVAAIQESTAKSVKSVEDAVEQIAQSTELAQQSGQALEGIVGNADATADQVNAIAAASEEQSAASEEINQSIEEVNRISGEVAQAMGQASMAINDLAAQAQNLSRLIEDMKRA